VSPAIALAALQRALRDRIRDVPDFPLPGVLFKDIMPVLADPELFRQATDALAAALSQARPTHVAAIESRGFLLGAPVAQALGVPLVPVRKVGKLPFRTERIDYVLEYGSAALEVHVDAWPSNARVAIVDDVLATGGTALASCELVERMGATVAGLGFLMSLSFLPGEERLNDRRVTALLRY
jgi:adenine phosphoribosyltransferase